MNNKAWWALALFVLILSLYSANAKSQTVGVMVGNWGYHWLSEDVTNEEHRLV